VNPIPLRRWVNKIKLLALFTQVKVNYSINISLPPPEHLGDMKGKINTIGVRYTFTYSKLCFVGTETET